MHAGCPLSQHSCKRAHRRIEDSAVADGATAEEEAFISIKDRHEADHVFIDELARHLLTPTKCLRCLTVPVGGVADFQLRKPHPLIREQITLNLVNRLPHVSER